MPVTLDQLDAWGNLDSAGLSSVASTMDGADSLSFQEVTASVSCAATVNSPDFIKAKSFVADTAATTATATADVGHIKTLVSAATSAGGSVSASAILIRLVNGQPTANVSATATITGVRQVETVDGVNYTVTVVQSGGQNVFALNGAANPALTVNGGFFYVFDVSDASNSGHPLIFKLTGGETYTAGFERTGTAGTSGATVKLFLSVGGTAPAKYSCSVHGDGMGNTITSAAASGALPTYASAETNSPDFNYVVNVDASAATAAINASNGANATFAFASASTGTSIDVSATAKILGEDWAVVSDTTGIWAIQ